MWRNNGNSTFTDVTGPTGFAGSASTMGAMLSDINNDRSVDLIVTSTGSAPTIFENRREGPFKASPLYTSIGLAPTRGAFVFDFNKDGWMDVAITHAGVPGISLWRNVEGKRFERVPLPVPDSMARMGSYRHRHRQRWLDRPRGHCRHFEGTGGAHLAQPRTAGI